MEEILKYGSEIVSFILGAIGGSLLTLSFKSQRVRGRSSAVDQSGARAGGDIVGRDKYKD